jgi:Flp pilus assembly protein TadG
MHTRKHSRLESSWLGKFIEDGAGTAAAEFALVLIPMVAILFGIMMMGSLFFIHNDMMNAAREAARRMSVDETVTFDEGVTVACDGNLVAGSVPEVACNALASWPVTFQVRASTIPIAGTDNSEMRVTITTDMGPAALIELLGATNGKTMTADVIMRSEFPTS